MLEFDKKVEAIIDALDGMPYFEWLKIRQEIDRVIGAEEHKLKRELRLDKEELLANYLNK